MRTEASQASSLCVQKPKPKNLNIEYKDNWLRIFSNQDKRLLREVSFSGRSSYVPGWMYDSSGVIFYAKKEILDFRSRPIYKLNVPRPLTSWLSHQKPERSKR